MQWKIKTADPELKDWSVKKKFAWFPVRIGDARIWFERYDVRQPSADLSQRLYPMKCDGLHLYRLEEFRAAGLSAWRLTTFGGHLMHHPIGYEWVKVKPNLRLVG